MHPIQAIFLVFSAGFALVGLFPMSLICLFAIYLFEPDEGKDTDEETWKVEEDGVFVGFKVGTKNE